MSFSTAMDALQQDAVRWDETADGLQAAGSIVRSLAVPAAAFSFAGGDVQAVYEELRARVETLLSEGETETAGAAVALRAVRRTYEGADQAAKDRIAGLWAWE